MHSSSGIRLPIREIAAALRARSGPPLTLVVDGVHGIGAVDETIATMGCDYFCAGAHKWMFAPKGCGFLWAHARVQDGIHPPVISHGCGKGFTAEFDWTGTRDFSSWLAVPAALDFLQALKPSRVRPMSRR